MTCCRCLLPLQANRSAQRCLACEWVHVAPCVGRTCGASTCFQPPWPQCPEPDPVAAGVRYDALLAARAAAKLAKDLAAEKARLVAELAVLDPPPKAPEKTPEERAAEIRARLAEIAAQGVV